MYLVYSVLTRCTDEPFAYLSLCSFCIYSLLSPSLSHTHSQHYDSPFLDEEIKAQRHQEAYPDCTASQQQNLNPSLTDSKLMLVPT